MSITLTYWEDPIHKRTPDDYDEIRTVVLKTVRDIPQLITSRPKNCTMISTQRSACVKLKNGKETDFCRIVWEKNATPPSRLWPKLGQITITYPPDFDGELWIHTSEEERYFRYEFAYAKGERTAWDTLVKAAREIIAQEERRKGASRK